MAVLGTTGLEIKLFTTDDGGSNWDDRGARGDSTVYVRFKAGDMQSLVLFLADGDNGIGYSKDLGDNITFYPYPGEGIVRGVEPYG